MKSTPRVDTLLDMLLASRAVIESCTPECPTLSVAELAALARCRKCQAWVIDALVLENDRQQHEQAGPLAPEREPGSYVETKPFRRQNPDTDFDHSDE